MADLYWNPYLLVPGQLRGLKLEVSQMRIQRLQDVREKDAKVEGGLPNMKSATPLKLSQHVEPSASAELWQDRPAVAAITSYKQVFDYRINQRSIS